MLSKQCSLSTTDQHTRRRAIRGMRSGAIMEWREQCSLSRSDSLIGNKWYVFRIARHFELEESMPR